jgi:hypothetical protein
MAEKPQGAFQVCRISKHRLGEELNADRTGESLSNVLDVRLVDHLFETLTCTSEIGVLYLHLVSF